jgi:glycosyltransferase involved in cell wall biosynthesis
MGALSGSTKAKKISILAPFVGIGGRWIDDFCSRSDLEFEKAPFPTALQSWHTRGATTPISDWLEHCKYAYQGMKGRPECIVTSFPQLALVTAALLQLTNRTSTRLVAWNFNLGSLPGGWKRGIAKMILRRVDRFVVHATGEIGSYARWLGVSEHKFHFVPLQRGEIDPLRPSRVKTPYIVSMGSAHRDYQTLVDAIADSGITTVIISKKNLLDSLPEHPNLVKLHGLTLAECNDILGAATVNVVPMSNAQTASGQVTFTTSMRMGVATVASRCIGTTDYIRDGETGLLVPPGDSKALSSAITKLWYDDAFRSRIGAAGRDYGDKNFSDEAAGEHLGRVIDEVLALGSSPVQTRQRNQS